MTVGASETAYENYELILLNGRMYMDIEDVIRLKNQWAKSNQTNDSQANNLPVCSDIIDTRKSAK